jgi:phosphoribosylamine--glycine ligase
VIPTVEGLKSENIPYKGFIFIGLMNCEGEPYVIEYNCRMGDPETESVLPRIESDFLDLLLGIANQDIHKRELKISPKTAATVMCVAGGYPGDYVNGKAISGIDNVRDSIGFQAGTVLDDDVIKTAGGRVLAVTTLQDNLFEALQHATTDAARIYYDGVYFRRDIGFDLI